MCDGSDVVKKHVVATGKPLLNRVSQTTPQFVQEKRVTVSESSSDSTSLQAISSQSECIKPLRIYEEEPEMFTDICDSGHDGAPLSVVDHDNVRGIPTTAELNNGCEQLERKAELRADAVVEGMDIHETISVSDQRVAHLSLDASAKPEPTLKDSSG
ncbi:unnamed protein product, partial [Trichobilharzia regenti]